MPGLNLRAVNAEPPETKLALKVKVPRKGSRSCPFSDVCRERSPKISRFRKRVGLMTAARNSLKTRLPPAVESSRIWEDNRYSVSPKNVPPAVAMIESLMLGGSFSKKNPHIR